MQTGPAISGAALHWTVGTRRVHFPIVRLINGRRHAPCARSRQFECFAAGGQCRRRDLKHWTYLSDFAATSHVGTIWECPDLFPLPVEGDPGTTKWVLIVNADRKRGEGGSFGVYFLGDFDGRRVLISWMNNWDYARVLPTSP